MANKAIGPIKESNLAKWRKNDADLAFEMATNAVGRVIG